MRQTDREIISGIASGDARSIARMITLIENHDARATILHQQIFKQTGKAHVIGITGSPGAGKSTLVNQLAREWRKAKKKVAILAVDPTSPFSGGAVLGDRIRMEEALEDPGIYARSMATRGALGGLAAAAADAIDVLDAAGFDIVLVETVGVGQGEVDIARASHSAMVVLTPGMGDEVQVMKAGIMEIADIFVINKADRPGAFELERELRMLLSMDRDGKDAWQIPIRKTVAIKADGIGETINALEEHKRWLSESGNWATRRAEILRTRILRLVQDRVRSATEKQLSIQLEELTAKSLATVVSPFEAAKQLLLSLGFSAQA